MLYFSLACLNAETGRISPFLQNYQGPVSASRVLIPVVKSVLTRTAVSQREKKPWWILWQWHLLHCNEVHHASMYKTKCKWQSCHLCLHKGQLLSQQQMVKMRALWLRSERVALVARAAGTVLKDCGWIESIWEFGYWWMEKELEKPCGRSLSHPMCHGSF